MHLCDFSSEEYFSAIAKTIGEARKLIESGFSFVCDMEGVSYSAKENENYLIVQRLCLLTLVQVQNN
jgi:hypothetical protein